MTNINWFMICEEITVVACQEGSEIINVQSAEILIFKVVLIQPLETAGDFVHKSVNCLRRSVCVASRSSSNVNKNLQLPLKEFWTLPKFNSSYSPASFNGKFGVLSRIHSAAFVYISLLVVIVINSCKHEFNALTILPYGRQCNTKTCF